MAGLSFTKLGISGFGMAGLDMAGLDMVEPNMTGAWQGWVRHSRHRHS